VSRRLRLSSRPHLLLMLVFGTFLGIVGITASVQSALVSEHFTASMLGALVDNDSATARSFVTTNLGLTDLTISAASDARAAEQARKLAALVSPNGIIRLDLYQPDGTILMTTGSAMRGQPATSTDGLRAATGGAPSASLVNSANAPSDSTAGIDGPALREYLPITVNGNVAAVLAIWRNAVPTLATLDETRRDVLVGTLVAAGLASAALWFLFRGASQRINRQTRELVEATRLDALTGLQNHGTVVAELAVAMDAAKTDKVPLAVALLDIDNFRSLNDVHGYRAGDDALLRVAALLEAAVPAARLGRYGPDEYLALMPGSDAQAAEKAVQGLLATLTSLSLKFENSEALPITASAGIAVFPEHGQSVTSLLSVAALALDEAKASGGNALRIAHTESATREAGFTILQGLVIAVDTKDRYTRRHSEDVARYALFLADQLGLDAETRRVVRAAGLLHDVGKIAIPDQILRKPGRLTSDEVAVMQQHVAMGDAIVRGIPDMDVVRQAIRSHHERWDGAGYLDHLQREGIPLIARLIAVGDAFSAMTTSRPYRKALSVDEALRRIEDAAGSQLDARFAMAFVEGIRSAKSPPLPTDAPSAREAIRLGTA
jgi:diguanylate cyclase (GGDEF)-like protein/putative nucleotidyltransferase with HDIG domain